MLSYRTTREIPDDGEGLAFLRAILQPLTAFLVVFVAPNHRGPFSTLGRQTERALNHRHGYGHVGVLTDRVLGPPFSCADRIF